MYYSVWTNSLGLISNGLHMPAILYKDIQTADRESSIMFTFLCSFPGFYFCWINLWCMDQQSWSDLGWISHAVWLHGPSSRLDCSGDDSLESYKNVFLWVSYALQSTNVVCALQITWKVLSFTLEDSWENKQTINGLQ